jgi:hypothetical protein
VRIPSPHVTEQCDHADHSLAMHLMIASHSNEVTFERMFDHTYMEFGDERDWFIDELLEHDGKWHEAMSNVRSLQW